MGFFAGLFRNASASKGATPAANAEPAPASGETLAAQGDDYLASKDIDRAVQCYREAIRLCPDNAELYVRLSDALKEQKRLSDAETLLVRAVALKPDLWQAHFRLGAMAEADGQWERAIARYRTLLQIRPPYTDSHSWPEVHWRLTQALIAKRQYEEALDVMREFVAIHPAMPEGHVQLGTLLHHTGRYEQAIEAFEQVMAMSGGNHAQAAWNLALNHLELQHWDLAREYYRRASELDPANGDVKLSRAFLSLLLGDFRNGWVQFEDVLPEIGDKTNPEGAQAFRRKLGTEKRWRGSSTEGKKLLVWTEHGLGDCLMMARYVRLIPERFGAGEIHVLADPKLARLFSGIPEVSRVLVSANDVDATEFDWHCSIMSLPYVFGTWTLADIPNRVPYLDIPDSDKTSWAARLQGSSGLRVGLVWGGNTSYEKDKLRSVRLGELSALMAISGISWFSLQKGGPTGQLQEAGLPIIDFMDDCRDMLDTGALASNLDLVISVDTSVAHLAGALGRPVWLLNRYGSEWRWLLGRDDSPWYPTMRIFNQAERGNWAPVIDRMATELRALTSAAAP